MALNKIDGSYASKKVRLRPQDYLLDMAMDLKLIIIFIIITLAFIYVPAINGTVIRSVLGVVMVLFVPGYALMAAVFPGKMDIDSAERAALAFGLSVIVSPLIALALNYTPWGIRLVPLVTCLTLFTLACLLAANKRRHDLPEQERFSVDFAGIYRQFKGEAFADGKTRLDKAFTIVIIASMLLSASIVVYAIAAPKQGEKFTELYILNSSGKVGQYPTVFSLGDSKPVIVGVINHEYRNVTYDLVIALNDSISVTNLHAEQWTLGDSQKWEKPIELKPDRAGTNMTMEFLLYIDGNMVAPYRECRLRVDVTNPL
jgi:uncharacterized membrane protein